MPLKKPGIKARLGIFLAILLIADQIVKICIKLNMNLGDSITVFPDWFFIHFIENPGAAFGMQLGGDNGKLLLSLFRIVAICAMVWLTNYLCKKENTPKGVLIAATMIIAGAIGNMIDSAFYGLIFSESTPYAAATMFPEGGGYGRFLHGKVVDMFYFPIIDTTWPEWLPWIGGDRFTFFDPVFNIADSYITVAVIYLIFFQSKFFMSLDGKKEQSKVVGSGSIRKSGLKSKIRKTESNDKA